MVWGCARRGDDPRTPAAGADPNKQDKHGWTALMFAAACGEEHSEAMMRLLVQRGATLPPRAERRESHYSSN